MAGMCMEFLLPGVGGLDTNITASANLMYLNIKITASANLIYLNTKITASANLIFNNRIS